MTSAAIETVLGDFRAWLEQASAQGGLAAEPEHGASIDLHTLVAQFSALRHEVNLQTKATRAQQEQNGKTLEELSRALDDLQERETEEAKDELLRPLIKTLIDATDALSLGRREVERGQQALLAALERLRPPPAPLLAETRPTLWQRWFGRGETRPSGEAPIHQQAREVADRLTTLLDSILMGYAMSLQRMERALAHHGLEPIPAVGELFDPESMEVVEVATDAGALPNTVTAEVRRGYLWHGRVLRCAQVCVAK